MPARWVGHVAGGVHSPFIDNMQHTSVLALRACSRDTVQVDTRHGLKHKTPFKSWSYSPIILCTYMGVPHTGCSLPSRTFMVLTIGGWHTNTNKYSSETQWRASSAIPTYMYVQPCSHVKPSYMHEVHVRALPSNRCQRLTSSNVFSLQAGGAQNPSQLQCTVQ